MKIRLAKKILYSRFYFEKHRKMRPDYYDEVKKCWVSPSFADIPEVERARTRYFKWVGVYKKKNLPQE